METNDHRIMRFSPSDSPGNLFRHTTVYQPSVTVRCCW